ncbi:hypothetical protein HOU02_gp254 [Caulobacter phage CcrBL9]|uniref:Uncharacterized protein n=1 Tax=Caulobacter phage CcrBL9 TaxID=2283270 RepID=A0A385EC56_9CAUD|nr:hypothetical protein HOU02_gp254 [Caulobacter phage CcrBL9]AXQ69471.1 hypothetical protein CcrBL9_gp447 [Caulobacter phage CcrBL9]
MPSLAEATDLMLLKQGLASLEVLERSPTLRPSACYVLFIETFNLGSNHDWSLPFLEKTAWGHLEVQTCHACGAVRRPRFGPYYGVASAPMAPLQIEGRAA